MQTRLTRHPISSGRRGISPLSGFTLIELMVTVAIVGILAGIAYPTYTASLVKGRRSDAEAVLMDIAQRQQQYLLDARVYAASVTSLNATVPSSVSAYYSVAITATVFNPATNTQAGFTATATPIAGTAQGQDVTLSIDNTGAKSPSSVW